MNNKVEWPTYADCPYCGWAHDTEGWTNGESVFCESCHRPFKAEELK